MQLLDLPSALEDIKTSLSLTGITILKESKYKSRYSHTPNLTQISGKGYYKNDDPTLKIYKKEQDTKKKKKQQPPEEIKEKKVRQKARYIINKKEVTHRIRNMVLAMKGKKELYFWTITFPLHTSDNTAFLLMNKWLTRLRKEKLLKSYIWVTERQQNSTIHFHMAIPHRLDVKKANKYMRASIMWCIKAKEIDLTNEQAIKYNGVDIAKNRKTKRVTNFAKGKNERTLAHYLTKYVTKNNEEFTHLAWHSSRDFSNLIIAVRFTDREISRSNIMQFINMGKKLEGEYYTFYTWLKSPPASLINHLSNLNASILSTFSFN